MTKAKKANPLSWLPKQDIKQIKAGMQECLKYICASGGDVKTAVMKVAAAVAYGIENYTGFVDGMKELNANLNDNYIAALAKLGNGGRYSSFMFAYAHKFNSYVRGIMDLDDKVQEQLEKGVDVVRVATGVMRHLTIDDMTVSDYGIVIDRVTRSIRTEQQQRALLSERKKRNGVVAFDKEHKKLYATVGSVSCELVDTQVMDEIIAMIVDGNRVSQFISLLNAALKSAGRSLRCKVK